MKIISFTLGIFALVFFYDNNGTPVGLWTDTIAVASVDNTIKDRFIVPSGYIRTNEKANSFQNYLRNLPLKPLNSLVTYYNGAKKENDNIYDAVIDLPIGNKDLHQCADAVMRLRADYFYTQKKFDSIHFNFTNGFTVNFSKWIQGYRIAVKGNHTYWVKIEIPNSNYESYWKYMEQIFQYAGTASLAKELTAIPISKMKIGDVFIKGGFPGHAVIVVDMAVNNKGKKIFLLAQSYMPAQELQILKNPNNSTQSPWFNEDFGDILETPEWVFKKAELKRFQ
jgi:Domain of unknown function (4846)